MPAPRINPGSDGHDFPQASQDYRAAIFAKGSADLCPRRWRKRLSRGRAGIGRAVRKRCQYRQYFLKKKGIPLIPRYHRQMPCARRLPVWFSVWQTGFQSYLVPR